MAFIGYYLWAAVFMFCFLFCIWNSSTWPNLLLKMSFFGLTVAGMAAQAYQLGFIK